MIVYILSALLFLSIVVNILCINALLSNDFYLDIDSVTYCGDRMTLHSKNRDISISYLKISKFLDEIHEKMKLRNSH